MEKFTKECMYQVVRNTMEMREFWAKKEAKKRASRKSQTTKDFIKKIKSMKEFTQYAHLGIKDQLDVNLPYAVDGKCIYPFGKEVTIP